MNDFDCVVVNGDQYSTAYSYGEYIAARVKLPCYNLSVDHCDNDRITRTTVEFLESLKLENKKPLVIIGWTHVNLGETWYYGQNEQVIATAQKNNLEAIDSRLINIDLIPDSDVHSNFKKSLATISIEKRLIDWYTNMFLLRKYLLSSDIKYFFFSAANNKAFDINLWPAFKDLWLVRIIQSDPSIHKLHEFCLNDYAISHDEGHNRKTGRLSRDGHHKFGDLLFDLVASLRSRKIAQKSN